MRKIFSLLFFCTISCSLYAQNNDTLNYIRQNAVVIDTAEADTGYSDLMPLKSVVANRRIIGLGEATHGTQQFQAIKFRIVKFLVEQMGYRVFSIEANFTECRRINDYVMYGKGDARTAINGIYFWIWNTTKILQMVEWMHSYNLDKPDSAKLKFYGFDMQFDKLAVPLVAGKLRQLDSNYYNTHFKALADFKTFDAAKLKFTKFSDKEADSYKQLFIDIAAYLNTQQVALLKIFSVEDVAYLERDVRLLQQCLDYDIQSTHVAKAYLNQYNDVRDKYMAENIEWISNYEGPQSKMIVWAHNTHVDNRFMGAVLKKAYGDQYYIMGFDFNKGSFRARNLEDKHKVETLTVGNAWNGSSGDVFSRLNIPAFFIDMEKAVKTNSIAAPLFTKKILQRVVGAEFSNKRELQYYFYDTLYDNYDGLIFVNSTTATQANK
jgi:erythromycin esterase